MTSDRPSYAAWIEDLEERCAVLERPELAALVAAYIEHLRSEQASDLGRLMSHMAPDVTYHRYGVVTQSLNADELRSEMQAIIAAGGFPEYQMAMEHLVVDGSTLVVQGELVCEATGTQLTALGRLLPEGAQPTETFIVTQRLAAFFDFADGLMTREVTYRGPTTVVRADQPGEGAAA
jgi:ketosteroid isomerase-like protein